MRFRSLFSLGLFATFAALSHANVAHASTVTDHFLLTYDFNGVTQSDNFTLQDGAFAAYNPQGGFTYQVQAYSGTDQTGSPDTGSFEQTTLGDVGLFFANGIKVYGHLLKYVSSETAVYQGPSQTGEDIFFAPGTHNYTDFYIGVAGSLFAGSNASLVITQTAVPDPPAPPVAVTPEPSTFALLGTGLLGLGCMLKRNVAGA